MYKDRQQAGVLLGAALSTYKNSNSLIMGITRGGVIVAKEVAAVLNLNLIPIVVKKIGAYQNPELALGAVTYGKTKYIDWNLVKSFNTPLNYLKTQILIKFKEVDKLKTFLEVGRIYVKGKIVIVIDDGVATGASALAVLNYLKKKKTSKIILAIPIISSDVYENIKNKVDKIVVLEICKSFSAVGQFYKFFPQVSDLEVIKTISVPN